MLEPSVKEEERERKRRRGSTMHGQRSRTVALRPWNSPAVGLALTLACLGTVAGGARHLSTGAPNVHHRSTAQYQPLLDQIHVDLQPWQESGITLEMVERTYCTNFEKSMRFQVIDGEMYIAGEFQGFMEFNKMTKLWILEIAKRFQLPDLDLVLTTSDGCPPIEGFTGNWTKCDREAPLFAFDRRDGEHHCVRYPDHTMYSWPTAGLPSWENVRFMMDMNQPLQWKERQNTMLFRGAQTGNREILTRDETFVFHPHTEFRVTGWTGETAPGEYVTLPAHCLHKYLLHLPGMAYSARLKYLMYCNSTVIFAGMEHKEFWYHLLKDGENIVLLPSVTEEEKGAHISRALDELVANPEKAERIAAAGYKLVSTYLQPDAVIRYFYELLVAYSKLQRFKPTRHPQAVPFKYSALGPDPVYSLETRECKHCAWDSSH